MTYMYLLPIVKAAVLWAELKLWEIETSHVKAEPTNSNLYYMSKAEYVSME